MEDSTGQPHPLLRAWDRLPPARQAAIAFPVVVLVSFAAHFVLFGLSLALSIGYAFFYGVIGTVGVVLATRAEIRKRHAPPESQDREAPNSRP
jgi:hypothetical protein